MRHPFRVSGRVVALVASVLLGGGPVAGCGQGQSPAPGGQAASSPSPAAPVAAASPAAPAAAGSPVAATAQASPAAPAGGAQTAAAPPGGGPAATPASIERGKQLFAQNCASCHGPGGKGDGPAAVALNPKPQNLTDDQWKHGGAPQQVYATITNGVPGTAMVSWSSLPDQDRWALVHFVRSLSGQK